MFWTGLLRGGVRDFIAVRVLAVVAYFQLILCSRVSCSGKIVFRAYKAILEVLVRRGRRYIKRKARRSVILYGFIVWLSLSSAGPGVRKSRWV